jgi:hypothetical protein
MRIKGANFKSHDIHGRQLREEFCKINSYINPQLRIPWIKLQIFRLHLDILISKNAFEKDRFLFYSMYVLRRGRAGFLDLVSHEEDVLFPGVQKIYDDPRTYAAANDGQYCKQYLKSAVHHFAKSPFDRRTSSSRSPNIEALWNGPVGFLSGHTDRIVTFRLPHCVQTNRRWRGMCIIVMSSVNRSSSNVKTFEFGQTRPAAQ